MRKVKRPAAKNSLLGRVRKQRLKTIAVLPSLITIINGLCGFSAIVFTSEHQFARAGYMILIAMIADVLDGRLARISRSTSSFGGQLDSLCDIVSFGIAPAFLMLELLKLKMVYFAETPALAHFLQRSIWVCAMAYISCAAIRLARFNVENEEDESAHTVFFGLPTPAAAGVIVSLVIFHQEQVPQIAQISTVLASVCENAIIYSLPLLTVAAAVLMAGRVRYPHILNRYIKGKKPFAYLLISLFVIGLILWFRQIALVISFCGFALSGFVSVVCHNLISLKKGPVNIKEQLQSNQDNVLNSTQQSEPA